MAFNIGGLGSFAGGVSQGLDQQSVIAQRAQQIQQMQFQLDQQKRELAGQAAAFQGMTQGGGMGGPPVQPPMPGQASQPAQPQANPNMPPPQVGPGQMAPPVQGPMPPQGPQMAPQGGQPPMGGGQQGQVQPGLGGQDLSTQGQLGIIAKIAQTIKAQNPGIDSATLFEAVKQQIGLLGALSTSQRTDLALTLEAIRSQTQTGIAAGHDTTSAENANIRAKTSENVAGIGAASREKVGAGHDATSASNTDKRISDADSRLDKTQAAINARQENSLQGRATKSAQTERLGLLKTQLSQAKQKLAAANSSGDQAGILAAQKGVDAAYAKILDFQTKVMGGKTTPAADKVVDFNSLPP